MQTNSRKQLVVSQEAIDDLDSQMMFVPEPPGGTAKMILDEMRVSSCSDWEAVHRIVTRSEWRFVGHSGF